MPIERGTRLGPYEIGEPIGAGGMGEVYRARDTRLDRSVAVKILPVAVGKRDELRLRFEREARAIAALSHPHICSLFDIGTEGETSFLVMELLDGETLATRIARRMPVEEVLRTAIQIADALDSAHRRGIVHRDLKPGNVMITKSGVKLLDFGLARITQSGPIVHGVDSAPATEISPITSEGMILGTLHYMSPEQLEGKPVDARTDIFSFGGILYEMLTGRRPFDGDSHASVITAIMSSEPRAIPEIAADTPAALVRLICKCLEKDRDERWQNAHDLATELRWIATVAESAVAPVRRKRIAWLWPVIAALALAALVASLLLRRAEPKAAAPIHLSIPIEGRIAQMLSGGIAISPDGEHIVFEVLTGNDRVLMRRSLSDSAAVRIPNTDGATTPFFSPDSRFIAFFAGGHLQRVNLRGEELQTICEVPPGAYLFPAWAPDDTILIANIGTFRSLLKVRPSGGVPEVIEFPHLPATSRVIWPHFVGGSDHFLYVEVVEDEPVYLRLRGGSLLDRSKHWDLGPFPSRATVIGDRLLFVRDAALYSRPFDPKAMRFDGEPKIVLPSTFFYSPLGVPGFVASEKTLAYVLPTFDSPATWYDRQGRELGTIGPASIRKVDFSRDYRRVILGVNDVRNSTGDLWICDVTRGTSQQLTTTPHSELSPAFSPGGDEIAYTSERRGAPRLYAMALATGEERVVAKEGELHAMSDWAGDGRIWFDQRNGKTRRDLYVVNADGTGQRAMLASQFNERSPRVSPDARWVAYISDASGKGEVWLMRTNGTGERTQLSTTGALEVGWSGDGRELFYLTAGNEVYAVPMAFRGDTFDAGKAEQLFRVTGGNALEFDVNRDGSRFLIVREKTVPLRGPIHAIVGWQNAAATPAS